MKVYHGSYMEIAEIDLSKCEKNKDFGQGFYVTKNRKHGEEWAERIGNRNHTTGIVTEFEFGKYLYLEKDFNILCFSDYLDTGRIETRKCTLYTDLSFIEQAQSLRCVGPA